MTKHPSARRVHRTVKDEDAFVSGVLESSVWAKDHGKKIAVIGGTLLVLLIGLVYYRNVQSTRQERAAFELAEVRATVQRGNFQLSKQDLDKFIRRFDKTAAGHEAKLMLGQTQLQTNDAKGAITTLQPLASDVDAPLGYSAALLLGSAYEQDNQPEPAERVYMRIGDQARFSFQKREALDRAARIRITRNDMPGAIVAYEKLLATFDKDDPGKNEYEMRLAEIRAQGPPAKS